MSIFKLYILCLLCFSTGYAQNEYSFGVVAQRSATLTANIWNPILTYVEHKTGIKLILSTARTGDDSKLGTDKGTYDFVYSNQFFDAKPLLYIPILQPNSGTIRGQIVALENSSIKTVKELQNETIGFPSKSAFVGYAVPTDYLKKQNITFTEVFGGNQEGIMAQLKTGGIKAASVNSQLMKDYALRENFKYKVLWESEKFPDIPIAVHNRVPQDVVKKVQDAIAGMTKDSEGIKILDEIAIITKQKPPLGFSKASLENYQIYLNFYKQKDK
ncbi:MAG: hypothetical protein RL154_1208 [Pseudomonadota bacterium]|jgi:phosphonate transport system substrate-binding protein